VLEGALHDRYDCTLHSSGSISQKDVVGLAKRITHMPHVTAVPLILVQYWSQSGAPRLNRWWPTCGECAALCVRASDSAI